MTGTVTKFNYVYTDHLGSILKLTNNIGTVLSEQSFDAWGRLRNPNNWSDYSITGTTQPANSPFGANGTVSGGGWLTRGYTGHEHVQQVDLINMNGRMLSPDNNVADATNTQAYNRYSYVMNNPLKYIDPSGWLLNNSTPGRDIFSTGSYTNDFTQSRLINGSISTGSPMGVAYMIEGNVITANLSIPCPDFKIKTNRDNSTTWETDHSNDASSSGNWFSDRGGSMRSGYFINPLRESLLVRGFAGGNRIDMNNATACNGCDNSGNLNKMNVQRGGGGGFNTNKVDKITGVIGVNIGLKEGLIEFAKKSGDIGTASGKYLLFTKVAGKMIGVTSAVTSWMEYNKNSTTGSFIKATTNTGLLFLRINPFIGVGLGILDLSGGSDWFYNQVGNGIDNMGGPKR